MVQIHALRTQRFRLAKLDFTRIWGEAGAITINSAALLLLLAPLNMHVPTKPHEDIFVVQELHKKLPPPPPPLPPEKVEVTPRRPMPVTPALPQKIELPQPPVFDQPQPGDLPAQPEQIVKVDPGLGNTLTQPLAGAHLEYEVAPAPRYPIEAIRQSLTGSVTLRVLVDIDGQPIDVQIERSSGHRILDAAARKQVLTKWRFRPAVQDGRAVQAIGLIPVVFELER